MRADRWWNRALWPGGADGNDAMRRTLPLRVEHRAMMLAVATTAGREAGVRILREREQRRNQWKREGRQQQDGEQASHRDRTVPVYRFCSPASPRVSLDAAQIRLITEGIVV